MKRFVVLAALLASASPLAAQTWDSPFVTPPRPAKGLGIYFVDVAFGGVGAMARWQPTATSWGFRGGIAEGPGGVAIFGGGDVSGGLTRATGEIPLDMDWVLGVGAAHRLDLVITVPVGLTIGHTFQGDGVLLTPYATPRVMLDTYFGDDNTDLELDFAVDLGLDLRFDQRWLVRFGATLGRHRDGLAIGLVF